MTLPDLEDLNLFWINLMCIFVIIKGIIHVFYFYLVRFVNVSINDFGAGDDVAVVFGLGVLKVPPGTAVAVGAVPGGLGGPDIVSLVKDVLPGGGVECHVSNGGPNY